MSIPGIEAAGFTPFVPPTVAGNPASTVAGAASGAGAVSPGSGAAGGDFANMLADGIQRVEGLQDRADQLAVQAATGKLSNLHDYTIAATQASVATQVTAAVRNKALEAFNTIMRMQI